MSHAETCPVCQRKGKVDDDKLCHGCGGLGWVTIHDPVPYNPCPCPSVPYNPPYYSSWIRITWGQPNF